MNLELLRTIFDELDRYEEHFHDEQPRKAFKAAIKSLDDQDAKQELKDEAYSETKASYYPIERACYYLALYAAKRKKHFLEISKEAALQAKGSIYDTPRV